MIIFQTENTRTDLSSYGVSLNEESALFTDNIQKSYSLPFPVRADDDLWQKLGLPSLDNITNVEAKIHGKLLLPNRYYKATLFIGEMENEIIECNLSFGDEELAVNDLELKDLPWPIVLTPNLLDYAEEVLTKEWPATGFNFPMVYYPELREKEDYASFKGFLNNYSNGQFWDNDTTEVEGETVYRNRNVLAPMPYLLEILRFGFSLEGKTISGPAVDHEVIKKAIYIPDNYLEKFKGSEFQAFSFSLPDDIGYYGDGSAYAIHRRQFTLQQIGTYDLKFDLNLDPVRASRFKLEITQLDGSTQEVKNRVFSANSSNNRVKLEKELKINIDTDMQFDELVIEMHIPYHADSIAQFNSFEFAFKDGRLNEHPTYFSLGNFMPDMTFWEYRNLLKNWLNLDFQISDNDVRIDFTQDAILEKPRIDHEHLKVNPKKEHNTNRFYKLSYANDERVYYNRNGQVFSDQDEEGDDVIDIKMEVQPAVVEANENITTAVMPEDRSKLDFSVYNGLISGQPLCDAQLIQELYLQRVFENFWQTWLRYRVHSKTFKDSYECSVYEIMAVDFLIKKYNELHVIKKLDRKFLSEELMKVTVESETF